MKFAFAILLASAFSSTRRWRSSGANRCSSIFAAQ